MGRTAYFHTNTITPPTSMPERAPHLLLFFQNSASSTTGPKAAPKPAHAKDTMVNTEPSSRAQITPMTAMTMTVSRAMIMDILSESLRPSVSRSRSWVTLEDAASS